MKHEEIRAGSFIIIGRCSCNCCCTHKEDKRPFLLQIHLLRNPLHKFPNPKRKQKCLTWLPDQAGTLLPAAVQEPRFTLSLWELTQAAEDSDVTGPYSGRRRLTVDLHTHLWVTYGSNGALKPACPPVK